MTQSSDRLDRLEALMASQLEFNRQIAEQAAADRQAANERMTGIEQQTAENSQAISRLEQNIQASSRDITQLAASQRAADEQLRATSRDIAQLAASQRAADEQLRASLADMVSMIGTLAQTQEAQGRRIEQAITELQAANQRQERINDFLLRERGLN